MAKTQRWTPLGLVALVGLLVLLLASVARADYPSQETDFNSSAVNAVTMMKYTLGSGGTSSGGGFLLRGTLGQPQGAIGTSAGGSFKFLQGFWYGALRYAVYLPVILKNF